MTPAEELRAAAVKLRATAKGTTPGPWHVADCEIYPRWMLSNGSQESDGFPRVVAETYDDDDALRIGDADWQWIAFAHPGLADPLAAWLESWDGVEFTEQGALLDDLKYALRIARVINGGAA